MMKRDLLKFTTTFLYFGILHSSSALTLQRKAEKPAATINFELRRGSEIKGEDCTYNEIQKFEAGGPNVDVLIKYNLSAEKGKKATIVLRVDSIHKDGSQVEEKLLAKKIPIEISDKAVCIQNVDISKMYDSSPDSDTIKKLRFSVSIQIDGANGVSSQTKTFPTRNESSPAE